MATFKVKANGDMVANRFLSSKPLYDETTANLSAFGMTGWDFTLTGAFYESLSLQDIFETNNLVQALSSWGYAQPPGAFVSTEEIGFGGTYLSTYAEDAVTLTTAEKHYFAFRIYDVLKFAVTNILDTEDYVAVAEYVDGTIRLRKAQSVEFTPTLTDGIRLELVGSKSGRISYARLLNTDTLFTTAPSKAQLDMWYNIYVFLKTIGTAMTGALDNDYYIDITNKVLVEPTDTFTTAQEISGFKIKMADSLNVTHFQAQKTTEFTNLYGTAFLVWQTLTLAAIFGEGYVIDPNDTLQVPTVWGNQYYDTETKQLRSGTFSGFTFTNSTERPITVYVVNITATFSIKPNVTKLNDMEKMFLMSGTTSEILVLLGGNFYVDYTNNTIYNLSTIYGSGNEPSLTTFEEILSPVLKAKEFRNDLQSEYMQVKLTTPMFEGGMTYADFFSTYQLIANGDFSDGTTGWNIYLNPNVITITDKITFNGTAISSGGIYQDIEIQTENNIYIGLKSELVSDTTPTINIYDYNTFNNSKNISLFTDKSGIFVAKINGIRLYIRQVTGNIYNSTIDDIVLFNITALKTAQQYSPIYDDTFDNLSDVEIKAQLDLWVKVYALITGNITATGTEMLNDRYYMDYDNAKAYDYNIIAPYVGETPEDIQAFMEDVLAKDITLTSIPVKAKIYKDRLVILGSYVTVGE